MKTYTYTVYFIRAYENNYGLISKQTYGSLELALDFAKAHAAKWVIRREDNTVVAHS